MHTRKVILLFLGAYLLTRVVGLTELPVFADEAIYIRWAHMLLDDPRQFTFLPLYDGKTPLFIWLLVPLVTTPLLDPLFMGRLLSVIAGGFLTWSVWLITRDLRGSRQAQMYAVGLSLVLPFTFFYSRMALIDMLLTVFLAFSFWCFIKARHQSYQTAWLLGSGFFWGLALMTKTSAFYYLPVVAGLVFLDLIRRRYLIGRRLFISLAAALMLGLSMIGWMIISPLFPFLFQRSSDFAFTPREILTQLPQILETNLFRISKWLLVYLTPGYWLLYVLGIPKPVRRQLYPLWLGACLFLLPFLLSGKLLSSRYFLPLVIWLIPAGALMLDYWKKRNSYVAFGIAGLILVLSLRFILPSYGDPAMIPFAHEDEVQYLTEWSAGYGIPEVRDFLAARAAQSKVYVVTEGYFGTLPDGLFMYFYRSPLLYNLEVHGIGLPISDISSDLQQKALSQEVYMVVNQHRFRLDPDDSRFELVAAYPRPRQAPALLLLRILP